MKKQIEKTILMDGDAVRRALTRIAHEIVEHNSGAENLAIVGNLDLNARQGGAYRTEHDAIFKEIAHRNHG